MGWGLSWGFSWQFVWILRAGWSPVTSGLGTQNACPPVIPQPPSWGLCLHVCLCNCVSCICVWTPGGLCVPVSVFPCLCINVSLPVYPSLSAPSASEEETWLLEWRLLGFFLHVSWILCVMGRILASFWSQKTPEVEKTLEKPWPKHHLLEMGEIGCILQEEKLWERRKSRVRGSRIAPSSTAATRNGQVQTKMCWKYEIHPRFQRLKMKKRR